MRSISHLHISEISVRWRGHVKGVLIFPDHKSIYKVNRWSYSQALVGKMWRFLPMADPLVSEFLVRDVDSVILSREVAAVNQWLANSTALVHIMRDHPSHNGLILAGIYSTVHLFTLLRVELLMNLPVFNAEMNCNYSKLFIPLCRNVGRVTQSWCRQTDFFTGCNGPLASPRPLGLWPGATAQGGVARGSRLLG